MKNFTKNRGPTDNGEQRRRESMGIRLTESDDNRQKHRCPEGDFAEKDHDLIDEVNALKQGVDRNPRHHDHGGTDDNDRIRKVGKTFFLSCQRGALHSLLTVRSRRVSVVAVSAL